MLANASAAGQRTTTGHVRTGRIRTNESNTTGQQVSARAPQPTSPWSASSATHTARSERRRYRSDRPGGIGHCRAAGCIVRILRTCVRCFPISARCRATCSDAGRRKSAQVVRLTHRATVIPRGSMYEPPRRLPTRSDLRRDGGQASEWEGENRSRPFSEAEDTKVRERGTTNTRRLGRGPVRDL
jgi:hypothetical protein